MKLGHSERERKGVYGLARLLYGKKIELVIDGTIVDLANVIRARTLKIGGKEGRYGGQ